MASWILKLLRPDVCYVCGSSLPAGTHSALGRAQQLSAQRCGQPEGLSQATIGNPMATPKEASRHNIVWHASILEDGIDLAVAVRTAAVIAPVRHRLKSVKLGGEPSRVAVVLDPSRASEPTSGWSVPIAVVAAEQHRSRAARNKHRGCQRIMVGGNQPASRRAGQLMAPTESCRGLPRSSRR